MNIWVSKENKFLWARCVCPSENQEEAGCSWLGGRESLVPLKHPRHSLHPRDNSCPDHPSAPHRERSSHGFADLSPYQRLAQERVQGGPPFLCGGESLEERRDTGEEERGLGRERQLRKPWKVRLVLTAHHVVRGVKPPCQFSDSYHGALWSPPSEGSLPLWWNGGHVHPLGEDPRPPVWADLTVAFPRGCGGRGDYTRASPGDPLLG